MTPIKAAADPMTWDIALADRVMQLRDAGCSSLSCTQVLGLIAFVRDGGGVAPAGNAGGVIPAACHGCANTGWCHATNKCTITGKPLALPQPREADPVGWRYVWPDGAVSWYSTQPGNVRAQPVYASPSPIPDAPVWLTRRSEGDAYFKILQTIARFPITDPKNMDAMNLRMIAEGAIALKPQDGGESGR